MFFNTTLDGEALDLFKGDAMIFFNGFWADIPNYPVDSSWLPLICWVSKDLISMEM